MAADEDDEEDDVLQQEAVDPKEPQWEQPSSESNAKVPQRLYIKSESSYTYVRMSLEELCDLLTLGQPMLLTEESGKRTIVMPSRVIYVNEEIVTPELR